MTEEQKTEIYAAYRDKVLGYLAGRTDTREDAEDLCAEVFRKAYAALPGYDGEKASLSTWIYTITRNTLTDYRRTRHPTEPLTASIRAPDDMETEYINAETLKTLASLLRNMGPPERDIIILRYYKGYSLAEISRLTGLSYGKVKLAHEKALKALRKSLD